MDPRTPVIVGAAQLTGRDGDNEPIDMMETVARAALDQGPVPLQEVRVVQGVWPYRDPGSLLAARFGIGSRSGLTQLGGNEPLDLLNQTAADIAAGGLDAALICSAETMRTRRRDRRAGRKSPYLAEDERAAPDRWFGSEVDLWEPADREAWGVEAVNFYALAASAVRHRFGDTPAQYLDRTSALWARASAIAGQNPHAWLGEVVDAETIASVTPDNRMVAAPFTKLMTSNIDVDQAAAIVLCSAEVATAAGVDPSGWVYPLAGSGAFDPPIARTRDSFAGSPSMRIAGARALELCGLTLDEIELIDLYSCFPSAVQVAQHELTLDPARPFTVTGGMTFGGGPFGSYCLHSTARAVEILRESPGRAFVSGNGGWFSKHAFLVMTTETPDRLYRYERPQPEVDAEPTRILMSSAPKAATIDAYTVAYDRTGQPDRAILAIADRSGARAWATSNDPDTIEGLLTEDQVGQFVNIVGNEPVFEASL